MPRAITIEQFAIPTDSVLSDSHQDVAAWVEASFKQRTGTYYEQIELKQLPSGQKLLDAKPPEARAYVMAAVEQTLHWEAMTERVRATGKDEFQRVNAHLLPGWADAWGRRTQAVSVIHGLTRRKLPFTDADLVTLLMWCSGERRMTSYGMPVGNLVRAVERYVGQSEASPELRQAALELARWLREYGQAEMRKHAVALEQLWPEPLPDVQHNSAAVQTLPSPQPSPAGCPAILRALKQALGFEGSQDPLSSVDTMNPTMTTGPDAFPLAPDSPLQAEHERLSLLYKEAIEKRHFFHPDPKPLRQAKLIAQVSDDAAGAMFLAAIERHVHAILKPQPAAGTDAEIDTADWHVRQAAASAMMWVRGQGVPWTRPEAFDVILYVAICPSNFQLAGDSRLDELIDTVERYAAQEALTEGERYCLSLLRTTVLQETGGGAGAQMAARLTALIQDGMEFVLAPGEVWADAVNAEYSGRSPRERQAWAALISHTLRASSSRPTKTWLKESQQVIAAVGKTELTEAFARWLPLVSRGRSQRRIAAFGGGLRDALTTMIDDNATALRGLLWMIPLLDESETLTRLVTEATLSAYKKVPGVGPRAVKVGNAGVYVLSELGSIDAVGQLAILKVRIKFAAAQKEIEKAFSKAAAALELPRDEIEEMGVPSYGLTEVGRVTESLGDYRAEILVNGADATLTWYDARGKRLKSVPSRVSKEHSDELKELKQSLKDIKTLLPAQRDRIDSLFLAQRTWPFQVWRDRYLEHPLVGTIASRLIWFVDQEPALFVDGCATTVDGRILEHGATADVALWHPVGRKVDEVLAWRDRLETLRITQPFKQAHREIYLLTAAETQTRVYSNRFAAHVLRQHQFHALCAARGWRNQLRLLVDNVYNPPTKWLPSWNLRAEFWVEGIGDDFGRDTNDAGTFHYLATDQVRFYRMNAAPNWSHAGGGGYALGSRASGDEATNDPLPLDQIPPLVFSEIMRDVDLFVGVASVGNDPTWQDGGPDGRYQDYWTTYSFGTLNETARTRRAVLERLVPRLRIADRCSLADRFLVVRGDLRTYKIHLGSGNILMEPNDRYLCIVPGSGQQSSGQELYLPFEGDRTLSIIISKAILLAADSSITDPSIVSQIRV